MSAKWPSSVATDADLYVAVNSLQTTLSTAINSSDASVVLASATGFPAAGGVTIDNEVIFYTGVSGATLTGCTRGADGTTAASHSVGVPVGASIIAFHHNGLKDEIIAVESFLNTHLGKSTAVVAAEFERLVGVTSAIQTQLDAKAVLALSNLASVAINTSLLPASDNAIDLGSSTKDFRSVYVSTSIKNGSTVLATATELGYLTGVTSAIQTQFGTKVDTAGTNLSKSGTTLNVVAAPTGLTSLNGSFFGYGRNRIINGDMRIDQRFAGAAKTVNGGSTVYTLDKWGASGEATDGVFTVTQTTTTPPTGFTHYIHVATTTADASIGASQVYRLVHYIEGNCVRDLLWGSASAATITLSFWVRSSLTGQFGGALSNSAANRSYPFTYTISSANTWEQKSITVTGDTTGTWLTDNGVGIAINFDLGVGSTFRGTGGSWSASTYFGATSDVSVIGTNAATFDLTGVQFEIGSTATAFEYRPEGVQLSLCQRYFEKSYAIGTAIGTSTSTNIQEIPGVAIGASEADCRVSFMVAKRAAPTITAYRQDGTSGSMAWYTTAGVGTNRTTSSANVGTMMFNLVQLVNNTDITAYGHWSADADL